MKSPFTIPILVLLAIASAFFLQSPREPLPESPPAIVEAVPMPNMTDSEPLTATAPACWCAPGCRCDNDPERPGCHCEPAIPVRRESHPVTESWAPVVERSIRLADAPVFRTQPAQSPTIDLPDPQPYRREVAQASKPTGWTGALVYVTNPNKAITGEHSDCPPCNVQALRLRNLGKKTKWRVGLLPENHFRFIKAPEDWNAPVTIFYRDGEEIDRVIGLATAADLCRRHPAAKLDADESEWTFVSLESVPQKTPTSAPVESARPAITTLQAAAPMNSGCFGSSAAHSMPASGCFGSSAAFAPQASGCFGASAGFAPYYSSPEYQAIRTYQSNYAPAVRPPATYHAPMRSSPVRPAYTPMYCGPDGCYPSASYRGYNSGYNSGYNNRAGLFGGSSMNSYSLIGLNLGVGF